MFSLAGLLVYLALEMVRPEVLFPGVQESIMLWVAIATACICLAEALVMQSWQAVPSTRFLVGFMVLSTVSTVVAGGDWSIVLDRLFGLAKILLMYLILIQCVRTERRVTILRLTLGGLILWLVIGGVLFVNGDSIPGFSYDVQHRLQYSGIFADPNDLSQMYAILFTLLLYFIVNGRRWYFRISAVGLLFLTGSAMVFSASRGGLLGVMVGIVLCFRKRMGTVVALLLAGSLLVIMMATGIGRMDMLDSGESSAELRLLSWAQGWYMLRSHPLLGVGFQNWYRYHGLAAHNSFIQVAGETGIPGLMCWLGFFYFPMKDSLLAVLSRRRSTNPSFAAEQLQAALIVWFVTALFLTRSQTLPPYIFAGLVIVANHVHFRSETQGDFGKAPAIEDEVQGPNEAVPEEYLELRPGPLVSWADMRQVAMFSCACLLWWRFMIRGLVPHFF